MLPKEEDGEGRQAAPAERVPWAKEHSISAVLHRYMTQVIISKPSHMASHPHIYAIYIEVVATGSGPMRRDDEGACIYINVYSCLCGGFYCALMEIQLLKICLAL